LFDIDILFVIFSLSLLLFRDLGILLWFFRFFLRLEIFLSDLASLAGETEIRVVTVVFLLNCFSDGRIFRGLVVILKVLVGHV
jgi:hypothetical protein